jgi:DNA gyrase/topoisomerase IV subunit A
VETASANAAIRQAFDVDLVQADAILSMQMRRLTPEAIQQMRVELSAVDAVPSL